MLWSAKGWNHLASQNRDKLRSLSSIIAPEKPWLMSSIDAEDNLQLNAQNFEMTMSQNLDTKRIQLTQSSKNHRVTSWSIAICKLGPGTGGGARAWLKNRSRWKLKRLTHLRDISFKFVKITEIKRIKTTTGLYKAAMPLMPLLLHLHLLQLWEDLCQALNDRNNAAPGDRGHRGHCGNSHQDMTHMAMEKNGMKNV